MKRPRSVCLRWAAGGRRCRCLPLSVRGCRACRRSCPGTPGTCLRRLLTGGSTAEHWEDTFTGVHRGTLSPGGTTWEGAAADAAQGRSFADLVKVRGLADALHDAAAVVRRGADQLDYLKRHAIDAVDEARPLVPTTFTTTGCPTTLASMAAQRRLSSST